MYEVLHYFTDTQDYDYIYRAGDKFPRDGVDVPDSRIEELLSAKNKRKMPLIKRVQGNAVDPVESVEASEQKDTIENKPEEKPKRGRRVKK